MTVLAVGRLPKAFTNWFDKSQIAKCAHLKLARRVWHWSICRPRTRVSVAHLNYRM